MSIKCDLVVVGAGPGGSMAAKTAAAAGLDVIMLEKRQEIGDPVRCAEGVGRRALCEMVKPDPRWIASEVKGAKIYAPDGTSIVMSEDKSGSEVGYVLERKVFDRALAMDAARAGAKVMVKTRALWLLRRDGVLSGVSAMHMGEPLQIEAPLIVGADGVESKVGRWAGIDTVLKPKDIHCCAQFLVQDKSINDEYCEFFFGNSKAPGGYVWAFPKGEKLANVGIGVQGSKSGSGMPIRLLKEFMKSRFPDGKVVEMVTGGDPSSGVIESATADGVILVGDAARQTDPITGGGILNAMKAGIIAGEVAAKAVSSGDVSKAGLKGYEDRWRADIGRHIARSYEYKEFFVKLTDDDLNQLIGSLKNEDISKMDLRGMLRVLFRLNPKLLWELRHLVI
ncbi:MAG: Digeranylgeranylglycerophospholipid reductase [Methanosaeta sp. PtaU1.Bin060]|nr:MAG: Digeranylgeranylglycerophospholipid reductase [Methanosaeta sp. PtaU1.Bin060]